MRTIINARHIPANLFPEMRSGASIPHTLPCSSDRFMSYAASLLSPSATWRKASCGFRSRRCLGALPGMSTLGIGTSIRYAGIKVITSVMPRFAYGREWAVGAVGGISSDAASRTAGVPQSP